MVSHRAGHRYRPTERAAYCMSRAGAKRVVDGNKRTALIVCEPFLALNGYELTATDEETNRVFTSTRSSIARHPSTVKTENEACPLLPRLLPRLAIILPGTNDLWASLVSSRDSLCSGRRQTRLDCNTHRRTLPTHSPNHRPCSTHAQ